MAGSINKVILVGRLGQDPKLTYMPSGSPVAEMSVATDESYKDREGNKVDRVEWHRVKVFGKSAEFCGNYLSKGRLVYVEGTLRTRSWEDQQGQKRYMTEVVVTGPGHTIQGLDSRGGMAAEAPMGEDEFAPQGGRRAYQSGQGGQGAPQGGQPGGGPRGGSAPRGGAGAPRNNQSYPDEGPGPAFPSEASGMDDVPF
ncbi:MAG: single-stranded DNA-binding protein [Solidesulfovibrio sp. DCME]|uniref:single-stranded DNA-binding protein n=1 Tax=Solidesulfovibrio sp. DCME TaxID=3447380 RepID=UPI003D0C577D